MHISTANYRPRNHERDKVRELVPQFLRDSAENLISFMEEYYDYLNREGYASYELSHVIDEQDIDVTSAKYLDAIQGEIAKNIPHSSVVDRNTLYKRLVHYYRIKGTPESVQVFFQMMFDSLVEVYYPGDNLMKLSAGNYATGSYSNSSGFLSNVDKIQDSDFWQDFSYQIRSSELTNSWRNSFSRLVHPAGMKLFALLLIEISTKSQWDQFQSYDVYNINESHTPPRLRSPAAGNGSHTPKYQPGWLSNTAISGFIQAIAENYYTDLLSSGTPIGPVTFVENSPTAGLITMSAPGIEYGTYRLVRSINFANPVEIDRRTFPGGDIRFLFDISSHLFLPGFKSYVIELVSIRGIGNSWDTNPPSLARETIVTAAINLPSSNWSNKIIAEQYFGRAFWDDTDEILDLPYFNKPLSSVTILDTQEYAKENAANRHGSIEAPRAHVDVVSAPL